MNKKKLNILFCLHYSGLNNGAVRSMVDIIETLVKKYNINAYVIYPDKKGSAINYLEEIGVTTLRVPFYRIDYKQELKWKQKFKSKVKYILKKLAFPYTFRKALTFCKQNNIDIVYSNTTTIDYGYLLSKKLNCPHFWHIREFGKEDHGLSYHGGEQRLYEKMGNSKGLIYISESIQKKYKPKMHSNSVIQQVVYNDISSAFINPKSNTEKKQNCKKKILNATIVGTIQEGKGQLDAIKAVESVNKGEKKIRLYICGKKSGNYYKELVDYVKKHRLEDQVYFDGFVTKMNEYRKNKDIAIVASRNEAFGRVTVEAMLSQLVVVGSNSAGTSELIINEKNGLLYEPGNVEMLANQLEMLFYDRNKLLDLMENGYRFALKFTKGIAADKIYQILRDQV